ncbi:PBECR4 domain-containing protein [Streptococcus sp. E17BB]|uniref:PBECR4 domain-containing protein n=1 Tax=Streptococcus sp. E17BB TaxID=3278714 RepID=UPI00359E9065
MTNHIQKIFDWYKQFNKSDILIKSKSLEFEIGLNEKQLPHLLGLHYISKEHLRGSKLYSRIRRLSDEEIFSRIQENNPSKITMVKDRVKNFRFFMENLENAYAYEQTHPETKITSDYLLVDTQDGNYLQLGIANNGIEDYLETFIVRKDDSYFKDSQIKEQVEGLYRLDESMIPVPFSFDLEKNRVLEEQRRQQMEQLIYRDSDLDGLSDGLEYALGTNPFSVDTDGDGISDGVEVWGGTNPKIDDRKQELQETIEQAKIEARSEGNLIHSREKLEQKEL